MPNYYVANVCFDPINRSYSRDSIEFLLLIAFALNKIKYSGLGKSQVIKLMKSTALTSLPINSVGTIPSSRLLRLKLLIVLEQYVYNIRNPGKMPLLHKGTIITYRYSTTLPNNNLLIFYNILFTVTRLFFKIIDIIRFPENKSNGKSP